MMFLQRYIAIWYVGSTPRYIVSSLIQNLQTHLVVDKVGFVEANSLVFSEIETLPFRAFKKQLHIRIKLVKVEVLLQFA